MGWRARGKRTKQRLFERYERRTFLQLVERYGLVPGVSVEVLSRDEQADTVEIRPSDKDAVTLGFRAASKIQVAVAD